MRVEIDEKGKIPMPEDGVAEVKLPYNSLFVSAFAGKTKFMMDGVRLRKPVITPKVPPQETEKYSFSIPMSSNINFVFEKYEIYPFDKKTLCSEIINKMPHLLRFNWINNIIIFSDQMYKEKYTSNYSTTIATIENGELKKIRKSILGGFDFLIKEASKEEIDQLRKYGVARVNNCDKLFISIDSNLSSEEAINKIIDTIYEYDIYKLCDKAFMKYNTLREAVTYFKRITSGVNDKIKIVSEIEACFNGECNNFLRMGLLYHKDPMRLKSTYPNYYKVIHRMVNNLSLREYSYNKVRIMCSKALNMIRGANS